MANDQGKLTRRGALAAGGAAGLSGLLMAPGSASAARLATSIIKPKNQTYYLLGAVIGSSYYTPIRAALSDFSKLFGVSASLIGPATLDTAAQFTTFETAIARPGTTGMVTISLDFKSMQKAHVDALKKGIPVVNYETEWGFPRTALVGESDPALTALAAAMMNAKLKGKGKVGVITNTSPDNIARGAMFLKALAKYPGLSSVGTGITQNDDASDNIKAFTSFYGAHGDMTGLWWADGGGGASAEYIHTQAPKLNLLLDDVNPAVLTAVEKGYTFATLGTPAYDMAFYSLQMAYWAANGWRVPDTSYCAIVQLTPANIKTYASKPYRQTESLLAAGAS